MCLRGQQSLTERAVRGWLQATLERRLVWRFWDADSDVPWGKNYRSEDSFPGRNALFYPCLLLTQSGKVHKQSVLRRRCVYSHVTLVSTGKLRCVTTQRGSKQTRTATATRKSPNKKVHQMEQLL